MSYLRRMITPWGERSKPGRVLVGLLVAVVAVVIGLAVSKSSIVGQAAKAWELLRPAWLVVVFLGGAVSAVAITATNILSSRKLQLEIQQLAIDAGEKQGLVREATIEEIERYGRKTARGQLLGSLALVMLLGPTVLAVFRLSLDGLPSASTQPWDLQEVERLSYPQSLSVDEEGMASAYGNLALIYQRRGDLDTAEAMLEEALALNEELGHKEGMASAYGNLGLIHQTRGNLDVAEAMHEKALALNEELGHKAGMASAYGNLGRIYVRRGDLDAAEAMFEKALAIEEELERKVRMAIDHFNLGATRQARSDLDAAEAMLEKALAINERLGRKEGMAIQYVNLGAIHQTRGNVAAAREHYARALDLFEAAGAQPQIEQVWRAIASLGDGD